MYPRCQGPVWSLAACSRTHWTSGEFDHASRRSGAAWVTATIAAARAEAAAITRRAESVYARNFNQFIVNLSSLQADNTRSVRVTLVTVLAAAISLLQAALGLDADVPAGRLRVAPSKAFKAWFPLRVSGLHVAGHPLTIDVDATGKATVETTAPLSVESADVPIRC